jgi:hypothetical protein
MAILTATAVTIYAPKITASVSTIIANNYIPIVQERLCMMLNNYFTSDDIEIESTVLFNATARSIVLNTGVHWDDYGFQVNDDFMIYRSWRNDGIYTINSLSNETLIVITSQSVVNERFNNNNGPVIYFSLVRWPISIQQVAALMVYFDCDIRDKISGDIKSRSLGPFSETFGSSETDDMYGYPLKIIQSIEQFKIVRFN